MIVKILSITNGTALIEWLEDGEIQRSLIPATEVDAAGECQFPERGLPYGIEWRDYVTATITPDDIQRSLRNAGIWTVQDLLRRSGEAQGAVNAAYSVILRDLIRYTRHL
ncbi:MAG TPA: hypothetical protein DEP36_01590 [Gammaproteobacteria bacterium]|nr:hypothetical protein [Gammaproteobacteria bacterium]